MLDRVEPGTQYAKHRRLCSRWPTKIRAKHDMAFAWISIDRLNDMCQVEMPIMGRRSAARSTNAHEIQHFDANRGARVWKRVPTQHFPGKYRPIYSLLFFIRFMRQSYGMGARINGGSSKRSFPSKRLCFVVIAMEFWLLPATIEVTWHLAIPIGIAQVVETRIRRQIIIQLVTFIRHCINRHVWA